jgi:tetratricopeptide (TPR) repeat protein
VTTQAKSAPAPPGPDALEAQGHQLMVGGDYSAAIPVLRHAVATADPSSLIYAYALYDLGRSLRLAGNPRAAVTLLWRRLQIPNQTDTVRAELTLALRALGQQATGGAPPAPGHGHAGHAHHGAGTQGPPGPAADLTAPAPGGQGV